MMNKLFLNNIGDLAEAQRASYYNFLYSGITKELENFPNPFFSKIKVPTRLSNRNIICLVYLYIHQLKFKGPNCNLNTALKRKKTYSIQIYISGEYSYSYNEKKELLFKKSKTVNEREFLDKFEFNKESIDQINPATLKKIRVKQDVFFGELPFLTEEGTFIINGCERVVISQIIRSPGIYFQKEFTGAKKILYTATLISDKGLWTKFFLDEVLKADKAEDNPISSSLKKTSQIQKENRIFMKLSDLKSQWKEPKILRDKKEESESDADKIYIYDFLKYFGLNLQEIYESLKYPLQLRKQKLGKKPPLSEEDFSFLMKRFFYNQRNGSFSIGEVGRYRINKKLGLNLPKDITYLTAQDLLAIMDGLIELKYFEKVGDDIDHIKNKQIRSIGELLQIQIRTGIYRLKLLLKEEAKSVSKIKPDPEIETEGNQWLIEPRGITGCLKEFFITSQLSQFMDQINPLAEMAHKRKITVFGPNGLKRDNISNAVRDIHPSQYGRLCPVETPEGQKAGLVTTVSMLGRISNLGWIETPYFFLQNSRVNPKTKPLFLNPEQESDTTIAFCDIAFGKEKKVLTDYISVKENYSFLTKKTKEINFFTMSPFQIISLGTSLIPFVEHDDANRALMGSNMQRQAVPLVLSQKPLVGTGLETIAVMDSGMIIKTYSEGYVSFATSTLIKIRDSKNQRINYFLRKHSRSNQETYINQKPIVWPGEWVYSGQLIADGPGTLDGELALGRNLSIGYMPWEGYNYEDAIILNERIVTNDWLTSVHIEEFETTLNYSVLGNEKLTNNLPFVTAYVRRNLESDGIIRIGSYVKEHDILVGKLSPCEEDNSAEARLAEAIFGEKRPAFLDTSLKVPHGTEGRVIDIRILFTNFLEEEELPSSFSQTIKILIAQVRKVQIGDKLAGRHGNKGIISRILPRQDMPYLPDGTPIDILFNPLGVPSRMNVGQVFECLLGLAGEKLGKRFKVTPFDEIYGKEASRILVNQKLKQAAVKSKSPWIFNLSSPGKILLRDGRTGDYFDNPITIGKSYILKLIHLVEDKIHARCTGPYSMITEQPLSGKSQNGGQRFGEMEVWALEAHGCSHTLQELLTIKSDDIDGRNDMYEAIAVRKRKKKPAPSIPEAFVALIRELHALGLDFSMTKIEKKISNQFAFQQGKKDIFQDLENRLKLRAYLARIKSKQMAEFKTKDNIEEDETTKEEIEKIKNRYKEFLKQQKIQFHN